jgi:hypothetical protein
MEKVFEAYSDESSLKDGGFIFQAILNYRLTWSIIDGRAAINQDDIYGWLKQVDVFPDMQFDEGHATLTYVILSEVNLLKRKFELASEAIKRLINSDYAREMNGEITTAQEDVPLPITGDTEPLGLPEPKEQKLLGQGQDLLPEPAKGLPEPAKGLPEPQKRLPAPATSESTINEVVYTTNLTSEQIRVINDKYFKGTKYDVVLTADNVVLREVSTSGLDSGAPNVTLKLSTGMVNTLDGKAINSWDNFKLVVRGGDDILVVDNKSEPKISEILVYDHIDNANELIFRTIIPSLILEFKGDRVKIDNYSNRSTQVSIRSTIDFDNLFNIDEAPKSEIEEPEEGEDLEKPNDSGDNITNYKNK